MMVSAERLQMRAYIFTFNEFIVNGWRRGCRTQNTEWKTGENRRKEKQHAQDNNVYKIVYNGIFMLGKSNKIKAERKKNHNKM